MAMGKIAVCVVGLLAAVPCGAGAQAAAVKVDESAAYEVATIKVPNEHEFAFPLRVYVLSAFGIPYAAVDRLVGPEWVRKNSYVIQAKPPEAIREAMSKMSQEQKTEQAHVMMQALLKERFHLQYHMEMQERSVYKLVQAKGGSKLKENPDASKGRATLREGDVRAVAINMRNLVNFLMNDPEIGGRTVVDETGLKSNYDFAFSWQPLNANGVAAAGDEAAPVKPSLFQAVEEDLGLKLVPARMPVQVFVIDHIELPSPN